MRWPLAIVRNSGSLARQASCASGQRPAIRQPGGMFSGLGGSPCSRMRWSRLRVVGSNDGAADHSARV